MCGMRQCELVCENVWAPRINDQVCVRVFAHLHVHVRQGYTTGDPINRYRASGGWGVHVWCTFLFLSLSICLCAVSVGVSLSSLYAHLLPLPPLSLARSLSLPPSQTRTRTRVRERTHTHIHTQTGPL